MSGSDTVLFEVQGDRGIVKLNRPDKRNSINMEMLERLHEILDEIEDDDVVRTVIFKGTSEVFCIGMDLEIAVV